MAATGAQAPEQDPAYTSARPPPAPQQGPPPDLQRAPIRVTILLGECPGRHPGRPYRIGAAVSTEDREGSYWFCIDHHAVEDFAGCGSQNRIGPFDTRAAAADALKTVAERERRYDAEDAAWDGDS